MIDLNSISLHYLFQSHSLSFTVSILIVYCLQFDSQFLTFSLKILAFYLFFLRTSYPILSPALSLIVTFVFDRGFLHLWNAYFCLFLHIKTNTFYSFSLYFINRFAIMRLKSRVNFVVPFFQNFINIQRLSSVGHWRWDWVLLPSCRFSNTTFIPSLGSCQIHTRLRFQRA